MKLPLLSWCHLAALSATPNDRVHLPRRLVKPGTLKSPDAAAVRCNALFGRYSFERQVPFRRVASFVESTLIDSINRLSLNCHDESQGRTASSSLLGTLKIVTVSLVGAVLKVTSTTLPRNTVAFPGSNRRVKSLVPSLVNMPPGKPLPPPATYCGKNPSSDGNVVVMTIGKSPR